MDSWLVYLYCTYAYCIATIHQFLDRYFSWSDLESLAEVACSKDLLFLLPHPSSGSRLRLAVTPDPLFISSRLAPPPTLQSRTYSHNGHSFLQYCSVCRKGGAYAFNCPIILALCTPSTGPRSRSFPRLTIKHLVPVKTSIFNLIFLHLHHPMRASGLKPPR
jgi:hypothetical protein